ncbi:prephenate dehydrogenase/arogenate dehydrogenase family protein [Rickettsiales bacterium]|nr:prephenate dehydrogenase/arogenate dehydrogenase family protein [Rickettsiales bacterium]
MTNNRNSIFIEEVTIIGPGLIGASIGLALKQKKIVGKIIGIDKNKKNLHDAIKNGSIDIGLSEINEAISNSDLFFLCTPVSQIQPCIKKLIPFLKKDSIVTDVGSVKNIFPKKLFSELKKVSDFIPGHPIAGTEFSGAKNAIKDLFDNKWCIITPENNTKKNILKIKKIWEKIGMNVSLMTPEEHDKVMSITSHLPHLIAFTIVGTAISYDNKEKSKLLNFSAGGFRDFTRIASSDPKMWRDIFLNNKDNILDTVDKFVKDLKKFRTLINNNKSNEIYNFIKKAKSVRKKIINLKQN